MSDPNVTVRMEAVEDYAAIADIHLRAFGSGYPEGLIVAMHRQRPAYDPRLSLVAERAGEVVGHILYSPRTHRIMGEDVTGVNLSPLGVLPAYQGIGVGGALIEAGDAAAKALGYAFSIVLGHKDYYPRFGYQGNIYGSSRMTLPGGALPDVVPLETRAVEPGDLESLLGLWEREEGRVDLALLPDRTASAWYSPDPRVRCTVYMAGSEIVGYTRIGSHEPETVRLFLAADTPYALRMAAQIAQGGALTLPLHPDSGSTAAFAAYGAPEFGASPYCMARAFAPSAFDLYADQLRRGQRHSGRVIWPAEFDV